MQSLTLVLPSDRALSIVFKVDLPEPTRGVLLELYVQMVLFCREQKFKNEQTSVLLSLIKSVHQANIGKKTLTQHYKMHYNSIIQMISCTSLFCQELL